MQGEELGGDPAPASTATALPTSQNPGAFQVSDICFLLSSHHGLILPLENRRWYQNCRPGAKTFCSILYRGQSTSPCAQRTLEESSTLVASLQEDLTAKQKGHCLAQKKFCFSLQVLLPYDCNGKEPQVLQLNMHLLKMNSMFGQCHCVGFVFPLNMN